MRSSIMAGVFATVAALAGCTPAIGDGCETSANCSVTGDRVCDTSQPGGSCTVFGCEQGTCPAEAVCVRWRPEESRLEFTACMRRCDGDGGCRVDNGYRCRATTDAAMIDPSNALPLAELVDPGEAHFCVAEPASDEPAP